MIKRILFLLFLFCGLLFSADFALAETTGIFTSQVFNADTAVDYDTIDWTETTDENSSVTMEVRAGNVAVPDGTWTGWTAILDGGSLSAYNGNQYIQYRATLVSSDDVSNPTLDDVTINYIDYSWIISNAYNTEDSVNIISSISWTDVTDENSAVKAQIRTSANGSDWTSWLGPTDSTDYYTSGQDLNSATSDGIDDQYFQYKLFFTSSNASSQPVAQDITISYAAALCGNGVLESYEQCDFGDDNGSCPSTCSSTCTVQNCNTGSSGSGPPPASDSSSDDGDTEGESDPTDEVEAEKVLKIIEPTVLTQCQNAVFGWDTQYYLNDEYHSDAVASTLVGYGIESADENIITSTDSINHLIVVDDLTEGEYKYYLYSSDGEMSTSTKEAVFSVKECLPSESQASLDAFFSDGQLELSIDYDDNVSEMIIRKSDISVPQTEEDGQEFYNGQWTSPLSDDQIENNKNYYYSLFDCKNDQCIFKDSVNIIKLLPEVDDFSYNQSNENSIDLKWNNPTDALENDFIFDGVRLIRLENNCQDANIESNTFLADTIEQYYQDENIESDSDYYYKIFVKNKYGQYSSGVCLNVHSKDYSTYETPEEEPTKEQEEIEDSKEPSIGDQDVVLGVQPQTGSVETESGPIDKTANEENLSGNIIMRFYSLGGLLPLDVSSNKIVNILQGKDLIIEIDANTIPKPVEEIRARLSRKTAFEIFVVKNAMAQTGDYQFIYNENSEVYKVALDSFAKSGEYDVDVVFLYQDESEYIMPVGVDVKSQGKIEISGENKNANEIEISLYDQSGNLVDRTVANKDGSYGFMAENGNYRLVATDGEKEIYTKDIKVINNVVNNDLNFSVFKKATDAIKKVSASAVETFNKFKDDVQVQETTEKAIVPASVGVAVANTAVAVPWWSFIRYLQLFFTEPLAWLFRKKRKKWGVIYNSITKKPVDLAAVRLYDAAGKLIKSKITDRQGRYQFLIEPGEYKIEVSHPRFDFPSNILREKKSDNDYEDLYFGGKFKVENEEDLAVQFDIPLDQKDEKIGNKQILKKHYWKQFRNKISYVGPLLSLLALTINRSAVVVSLTLLHIVLFIIFKKLAQVKKSKSWGVVFDKITNNEINKAIVRVLSPEYDKMLEYQVTDGRGRYGFLVNDNVYYVTAEKDGYQSFASKDIDLTSKKEDYIVSKDIAMVRKQKTDNSFRPTSRRSGRSRKQITTNKKKKTTTKGEVNGESKPSSSKELEEIAQRLTKKIKK